MDVPAPDDQALLRIERGVVGVDLHIAAKPVEEPKRIGRKLSRGEARHGEADQKGPG